MAWRLVVAGAFIALAGFGCNKTRTQLHNRTKNAHFCG